MLKTYLLKQAQLKWNGHMGFWLYWSIFLPAFLVKRNLRPALLAQIKLAYLLLSSQIDNSSNAFYFVFICLEGSKLTFLEILQYNLYTLQEISSELNKPRFKS